MVAHRGASHDNAEHTLGAYVAALDAGAEGLECDVRSDRRRSSRVRARPRPSADGESAPGSSRRWSCPFLANWMSRPGRTRGPTSTKKAPDLGDESLDPGPHAAAAAGDGGRLRPPGRGRGRDQAPHPLRRTGGEAPGGDAPATSAGTAQGGPVRVMSCPSPRCSASSGSRPTYRWCNSSTRRRCGRCCAARSARTGSSVPGIDELREHPKPGRADPPRTGHDIHVWTVNTPEDLQICPSTSG